MGRKISSIKESFGNLQQALVNLLFAPFVALAALFGLLFISLGFLIKSLESLIGVSGYQPNLGGEYIKGFGIKNLPDFYF